MKARESLQGIVEEVVQRDKARSWGLEQRAAPVIELKGGWLALMAPPPRRGTSARA